MIKNNKKSKKSTTKKSTFKISPLIPIVAIIEVIILVVISSYAWFYIQASKVIGSGTISVAADSGLDIDFQYSNVDDYINIWNYVGEDFQFEPATSLDGRNIYFPTTGTFNNENTQDVVFRDGTVNDINQKYLSIDFELTNSSSTDQYVYLNNNSYFTVKDPENPQAAQDSRALRLAFYQNDGNSGNVGSNLLKNVSGSSDGSDSGNAASPNSYTVFFDNSSSNWSNVYAYFWDYDDNSSPVYQSSWPGVKMTRVSGKIYSVTIDNPATEHGVKYDRIIFNNNNGTQTSSFDLDGADGTQDWKNHKFTSSGHSGAYSESTIYFLKPSGWNNDSNNDGIADVRAYAWNTDSNSPYTTYDNGDLMNYVGSGIYAYNYDSDQTGGILFNSGSMGGSNQTVNISLAGRAGHLIYCDGSYTDGKHNVDTSSVYSNLTYNTIYLFNTYAWEKPYATVSIENNSVCNTEIAMTSLSGNVYYCSVPSVFNRVSFHQKGSSANKQKTQVQSIVNQTVYRPTGVNDSGWEVNTFLYSSYIKKDGYPVISPGVSAGFQRPYSPVITIKADSGFADEIVPAYSNSIDNYILGSGTPLFILKAGHMASLSMIMWLEGTDSSCTGALYPGNQIDFKLEFSTLYYTTTQQGATEVNIVNPGDSNSYIYNFYDKTREIWTSNRQSTESGVTVEPVMQLYDNTIKRGYRMEPTGYTSYDGKQKVSCWSVTAPQSIAKYGHDIYFRRVNPYNEDEVWNYWHAGPVAGDRNTTTSNGVTTYNAYTTVQAIYPVAVSTTNTSNDTINFTAFSDGSPTNENLTIGKKRVDPDISDTDLTTYLNEVAVPDDSCGGLWGNHTVKTLTLLDGTDGVVFRNDNGIMMIKYSYQYKSGTNVTIEYKASGPNYLSLYYFVVPEGLYDSARQSSIEGSGGDGKVYFKRYYNFNGSYAINSEKNNKLLWAKTWDAGTPTGDYFEISHSVGVTNDERVYTYNAYWGSDILYVQSNSTTHSSLWTDTSKNRKLMIRFRNSSDNTITPFDVTLYPNNEFKGPDSSSTGFPVVIPNGASYNKYYIMFCNNAYGYDPNTADINNSSLIYSSDEQTIYTSEVSGTTMQYLNTAYNASTHTSENICIFDHFKDITIYFETDNSYFNSSSIKKIYFKNIYYPYQSYDWPGADFERYSNPYNDHQEVVRYQYTVNINDYNTFQVNNSKSNGDIQFSYYTITPEDQYKVFEGYYSGGYKTRLNSGAGRPTPPGKDSDYKKVIHTTLDAAVEWPHYSVSSAS